MNRKLTLCTLIGLITGSTATALALLLIVKPLAQVSRAQSMSSQPTSSPGTTTVPGMWAMMGQPDQHFIGMMIPHHEGAIAMADLALERSQQPEIRDLAQSIKDSQSREIEQMREWYQQWYGTEVPAWAPGTGRGMRAWNGNGSGMGIMHGWNDNGTRPDDGTLGMRRLGNRDVNGQPADQTQRRPGMDCWGVGMMQGNMAVLQNAPDFDRAFIEEMIPHHQMGVMMAQMGLDNSDRPEIRELAQRIIDTQSAEINQMQQWYQNWYQ